MSQSLQSTLKLGLLIATLLLAGVASAFVLDLVAVDLARDLALKSVLLGAIVAATGAAASLIGGSREADAPLVDGRR